MAESFCQIAELHGSPPAPSLHPTLTVPLQTFRQERPPLHGIMALLCHGAARAVVLALIGFAVFCYVTPYTALYQTFRNWNEQRDDLFFYYVIWVVLCAALVLAAALASAIEIAEDAGSESQKSPPLEKQLLNKRCWRGCLGRCRIRALIFDSRWLFIPFLIALLGSCYIWLGLGTLGAAAKYEWGVGWDADTHRGREYWQQLLMRSSLYAGVGALLPMAMLGVPLSHSSSMWRMAGLSYEEAISLHRALGHLMMALLSFHSLGYMTAWLSLGVEKLADELTDWFHCGRCTHINNLAGLIAWSAGLIIWATSVQRFRRYNYAAFFTAHQLHLIFFGFGAIHWPSCICFAAPTIIFYAADFALRTHLTRYRAPASLRIHRRPPLPPQRAFLNGAPASSAHVGEDLVVMSTLVIQLPPRSLSIQASPQRMRTLAPHPALDVSKADGGDSGRHRCTCPFTRSGGADIRLAGDDFDGGTVYLAIPKLNRCMARWEWHPFTVGAVLNGATDTLSPSPVCVVHAMRCKRWTAQLQRLEQQTVAPINLGSPENDQLLEADRHIQLKLLGPLPTPPALVSAVDTALSGTPLLLVGGGSGLVPLVAIVRRLARAYSGKQHEQVPSSSHVTLVCVARELAVLEILDGAMLPKSDSDAGETSYSWLNVRIHLTGCQHTDLIASEGKVADGHACAINADGAGGGSSTRGKELSPRLSLIDHELENVIVVEDSVAPNTPSSSGTARSLQPALDEVSETPPVLSSCSGCEEIALNASFSGPFRLVTTRAGDKRQVRALRSPFTPPAISRHEASDVGGCLRGMTTIRVHEICSVLGAFGGFVGTAMSLSWGSNAVPLYRSNVSTSASGGAAFVAACIGAMAGSLLLLRLTDGCAWLRSLLGAKERCRTLIHTWPLSSRTALSGGGDDDPVDRVSGVQLAGNPTHGQPVVQRERQCESCAVPVWSLRRPRFEELLLANPAAKVVAGGPEVMLSSLDAALASEKRKRELTRLTRSM